MKSFKQYCLAEMARPAKSFDNLDMNSAYAQALKMFKAMGIDNANTFTIWDFMFKQLPTFFHSREITEEKKKAFGSDLRRFVLHLLAQYPEQVNLIQWARDITDEQKIRAYIDRPDKGNRHFGRVKQDAARVIGSQSPRPQGEFS